MAAAGRGPKEVIALMVTALMTYVAMSEKLPKNQVEGKDENEVKERENALKDSS